MMQEWMMTAYQWVIIEGWAILAYALICHFVLLNIAKKRNADEMSRLSLYLLAPFAIGIWYLDQCWPEEPHAGILIGQYLYAFYLLTPFRYIVPFHHKAWNIIRRIWQFGTVLSLAVLLAYYDVTHFEWVRLFDIVAIVVILGLLIGFSSVLDADIPCPKCRRFSIQDDYPVREKRGHIFDIQGKIVICPYCGQIYNTETGETYEHVEPLKPAEAANKTETTENTETTETT